MTSPSTNALPPERWVCQTSVAHGLEHTVVSVRIDIDPAAADGAVLSGLPYTQRDRVRAAIVNSTWAWPDGALTLHHSEHSGGFGTSADLAVAIAILATTGQVVPWPELADTLVLGELGLDGSVRACRGVYPAVLAAKAAGVTRVIVPGENVAEAQLVDGIDVVAAGPSLQWVNSWLATATSESDEDESPSSGPVLITADTGTGALGIEQLSIPDQPEASSRVTQDGHGRITAADTEIADLPERVLRAAALAAAGGHHMILTHHPGLPAGDVATFLTDLLPPLSAADRDAVLALWSLSGALDPEFSTAVESRPEIVAVLPGLLLDNLYGRPGHPAKPGYMPLAHHGLLHLYDTAAMPGFVLDVVARTLVRGSVVAMGRAPFERYPAAFQLLATMPTCPRVEGFCDCAPGSHALFSRHVRELLGAHVAINVTANEPAAAPPGNVPTPEQVAAARTRAAERWDTSGSGITNQQVPDERLHRASEAFAADTRGHLADQIASGALSPARFMLVLRLMWTIADLDGIELPGLEQLHEALILCHSPRPH